MTTNWKFDKSMAFCCKDVENRKNVKYMENVMNQLQDAENLSNPPKMKKYLTGETYNQEQVQVTPISFKYLEKLYLMAKASRTHTIDLYVQNDMPLKAVFYDQRKRGGGRGVTDKNDKGKVIIAPLDLDEDEKERRERTKLIDAL